MTTTILCIFFQDLKTNLIADIQDLRKKSVFYFRCPINFSLESEISKSFFFVALKKLYFLRNLILLFNNPFVRIIFNYLNL